jgi:integrase
MAGALAGLQGREIDPRSYDQIEQHVRLHIEPHAGPLPMAQLRAAHVQELFGKLKAGGVSGAMLPKIMTTLRMALKDAVGLNLLSVNPAAAVRRPRDGAGKEEIRPWDAAQARRFLEAARRDRLHALYVLALDSGMRQGELFALHWPEVDWAGAVRVVRSLQYRAGGLRLKETKNKHSRRRVGLPAETMACLLEHREAMRKAKLNV